MTATSPAKGEAQGQSKQMDPLTHGILGGVTAYAAVGGRTPWAAVVGVLAGMAPDLDVFIRPNGDPLGGLSYHRSFTHALVVVPLGAALCALPFLPWRAFAGRAWLVLVAALVAYGAHGLLDAFTSYGTELGWPFTRARVAFDTISIIDPLFTAVLLAGLIWALVAGKPNLARAALGVAALYLAFGGLQHFRGARAQRDLANIRGHTLVRGRVMPTLGNLVIWNSVYESDGRLYTDSLRVPVVGQPQVRVGSSGERATLETLRQRGHDSPAVIAAFERFSWFADGYTAFDPRSQRLIGDMRYWVEPEKFTAMWGLELPHPAHDAPAPNTNPEKAVAAARADKDSARPRFVHLYRNSRRNVLSEIWEALRGRDAQFRPLVEIRRAAAVSSPHGSRAAES